MHRICIPATDGRMTPRHRLVWWFACLIGAKPAILPLASYRIKDDAGSWQTISAVRVMAATISVGHADSSLEKPA